MQLYKMLVDHFGIGYHLNLVNYLQQKGLHSLYCPTTSTWL
jgi:hypothetical protein